MNEKAIDVEPEACAEERTQPEEHASGAPRELWYKGVCLFRLPERCPRCEDQGIVGGEFLSFDERGFRVLYRYKPCPRCRTAGGYAASPGSLPPCLACEGGGIRGHIYPYDEMENRYTGSVAVECTVCAGTGSAEGPQRHHPTLGSAAEGGLLAEREVAGGAK